MTSAELPQLDADTRLLFAPSRGLPWIAMTVAQDELDLNPPGGSRFKPPATDTIRKLLQAFDDSVAAARGALANTPTSTSPRPGGSSWPGRWSWRIRGMS